MLVLSKRPCYINQEIREEYPNWINADGKPNESKVINIIKLLYLLKQEPRNYSHLELFSDIRYKTSFLKYLRLCKKLSFIESRMVEDKPIYHITVRGLQFLELCRPLERERKLWEDIV